LSVIGLQPASGGHMRIRSDPRHAKNRKPFTVNGLS
jgi:hypothetical protein